MAAARLRDRRARSPPRRSCGCPASAATSPPRAWRSSPARPIDLPGVILAALATVGLGLVLGPEAPLLALGSGLGVFAVHLARKARRSRSSRCVAAAGSFAAVSFLFESPMIAAVLLIEAIGLGGRQLTFVLIPGLLASAVGSLVSIGLGSFTGLSTSGYAIGLAGPAGFPRPTLVDFAWTVPLAAAVTLLSWRWSSSAATSSRS